MISAPLYSDEYGNPLNPTTATASRFVTSPYGTGAAYPAGGGQPDSVIDKGTNPDVQAAWNQRNTDPGFTQNQDQAGRLNAAMTLAGESGRGHVGRPQMDQPPQQPLMPAQNATQRWQEGASRRYYERKMNRGIRGEAGHMLRRIVSGDANVPGYGTSAAPPQGLVSGAQANGPMTSTAMGYGGTNGIKFNNSPSGWAPF